MVYNVVSLDMNKEFVVTNPEELVKVAQEVTSYFADYEIFALDGEMGSGKTTFMAAIGKLLQVNETVTSPTYSLVNEYTISDSIMRIFHFDLYRLKNTQELLDIGFEEYLYAEDAYIFIEWWNLAESLLHTLPHVLIQFEKIDETTRKITLFASENKEIIP